MRRAGYTNSVYMPIKWTDNLSVGATSLNQQLRDNILALDNRVNPYVPSIVHWSPPAAEQTVTNGTKVFVGRPSTSVNLLALTQYSASMAISIDVSMNLSASTASAFSVEAALHMRTNSYGENAFRYRANALNTGGYWIDGTNRVSGSSVGATQYAFWTGFKRHDTNGLDPFALTGSRYICDVSLAVSATNGSISTSSLSWALRFRANAPETISNTQATPAPITFYGLAAQ